MFHKNLKAKRLLCGLSQKQVADFLNITPQSVSKWEKGDAQPSIDYLPKLAECLKCDINDFFVKTECEAIDNDVVEAFFALMNDTIYSDTKDSDDVTEFILEHPTVLDVVVDLCETLKEFKTVQVKNIQGLFNCSETKARTFLMHLVNGEMLEKLDIGDAYFVVKDNVDGFIMLLRLQEKLCEVTERHKDDT